MNNCPICLEDMNDNSKKWICPHCKKEFHDGCVSIWFASGIGRNNCPLCRQIIPIDISIILQSRQSRLERLQTQVPSRSTVRNRVRNHVPLIPRSNILFNYIPRYYFILFFSSSCSIIAIIVVVLYLFVFSKLNP